MALRAIYQTINHAPLPYRALSPRTQSIITQTIEHHHPEYRTPPRLYQSFTSKVSAIPVNFLQRQRGCDPAWGRLLNARALRAKLSSNFFFFLRVNRTVKRICSIHWHLSIGKLKSRRTLTLYEALCMRPPLLLGSRAPLPPKEGHTARAWNKSSLQLHAWLAPVGPVHNREHTFLFPGIAIAD